MKAKAKRMAWAVVSAYDGPAGERGLVLSRHETYDAARRANRRRGLGNWTRILDLAGANGGW